MPAGRYSRNGAIIDELDNAGRYQKDRAEYAGKTGQQRALLCFLQVLSAEYALHDGLVGAPVRDVVDTTAKCDHRPRNVRRLCVSRLDRIQVLRRGCSENADAFCDAAVAQCDKCQNRDQDDRADDKDDAVQRVRYGYGLQAAEDCIDTADYAECNAHYGGCHETVAAHQCGNTEDTLHRYRACVQHQRQHGYNISDKENERYNDAGCAVKAASRNSGIVEMPSLKYFGMKNSAISVNAIGHMVSHPIAVMPAA